MTKPEDFSATMRIDLTPDETQLRSGETSILRRKGKRIIRVAGRKTEAVREWGPAFSELLQNIYDAVLITDMDGNIVHVNDRAVQILGYSVEDMCRSSVHKIIEGANEQLIGTILKNLGNDRFTIIQAHCLHHKGADFPAEITVNRLQLDVDYLSFFLRDVSRRLETEARLRTGFNAIQNAAGGIGVADLDGHIIYVNPALQTQLGFETPFEVVDRPLSEFIPEPERVASVLTSARAGEVQNFETRMLRKDGSHFIAMFSAAPNFNRDGDISGLVLSVDDITEEKLAREQRDLLSREIQARNDEFERDLAMAREIQEAVLTRKYPSFPSNAPVSESRLHFAHQYVPCGMVGGDFYSILPISDTQAGIFISDVSGHGLKAGLVVATIRGLLEELRPYAHKPGRFLTELNTAYNCVFSLQDQYMFATAFYAYVDTEKNHMQFANAGHPPAFLLKPSLNEVRELEEAGQAHGPGIGIYEDHVYGSNGIDLNPGDRLVLYTDGLIEAENEAREYFETEALHQSLSACLQGDLTELPARLLQDARTFSNRDDFLDDVCVLVTELAQVPPAPVNQE